MNYLLKGELGFQGFVVSDWTGTHSGVSSILAGLDMTMPGDTTNDSGRSYFGGTYHNSRIVSFETSWLKLTPRQPTSLLQS